MAGIRGVLIGLGLWAILVFGAGAQTVPPGYTTGRANGAWIATSPDQGGGARVRLVYYPVESTSENFKSWFVARGEAKAKSFGTITVTHGEASEGYYPPKAPLISLMRTVKNSGRAEFFVESYGYDTVEGLQLVQIVSNTSVPEENAAYKAALGALATDWGNGVFYKPPAQPADTAIPPPPAGKKNCRREPVWGWAVRYGCSPSAVCNERVIKRYEWVCDR